MTIRNIKLVIDDSRGWIDPKSRIENIFIEGENIDALSLLELEYTDKIDCIYIDPPYNTKNNKLTYKDSRYDWSQFMKDRLVIAQKLLSVKGVIFISIDDHEVARLRILCDEVFGKKNHLGTLVVVNNSGGNNSGGNYSICHEYVLVYAKRKKSNLIAGRQLTKEEKRIYKFQDNIGNYKLAMFRKTGESDKRSDRPNLFYPIYWDQLSSTLSLDMQDGYTEILPFRSDGSEGRWRWEYNTFKDRMHAEIEIKLNKSNYPIPYIKIRSKTNTTRKYKSVMNDPSYSSKRGTDELARILGTKDLFTYAKPVALIKDLIRSATTKDSIVLDFFAGSGTTGQAVHELNKEDDGQRQFILVNNNEKSDKLPNGICHQVAYPRLETTTKEGVSLTYFTIQQNH